MLIDRQPRTLRDRLQLAAFAMVVLVISIAASLHLGGSATSPFTHLFGDDLVPSYMAGTFVREGRTDLLTDYAAAERFQTELRTQAGLEQHGRTGPWLNPPFYAAVFAPLSALPYRAALWTWFAANLFMLSAAILLLYRMLPSDKRRPMDGAIIAALVVVSMPALQAMACQQNTFLSLLILCSAITLARSDRAFAAGAVGALLLFKPQLAVIVCGALVCTLGRRTIVGMIVTSVVLLAATFAFMPGTIGDYLHKLPGMLPYLRTDRSYPWERQTTFLGFWRLLIGGRTGGPNPQIVTILWLIGAGAVAAILIGPLWRAWRNGFTTKVRRSRSDTKKRDYEPTTVVPPFYLTSNRILLRVLRALRAFVVNLSSGKSASRDRLLAATIAASPLLMPYYMDYDLLLLAVPAVMLAAERMRTGRQSGDALQVAGWIAAYAWMYINAAFADATGVSVIVLLMLLQFLISIRTFWRKDDVLAQGTVGHKGAVSGPVSDTGFQPVRSVQCAGNCELLTLQRTKHGLEARVTDDAAASRDCFGIPIPRTHRPGISLPVVTAIIAVLMAVAAGVLDRSSPLTFGHDLLPGYVAGRLVIEGRADAMYDTEATRAMGRSVIEGQNLTNDPSHVFWINPPGFAVVFAPLAFMPFRTALLVWLTLNAAMATAAFRAILGWIPNRRAAFAVGIAALTSCPFLLAVEHQQSTFISLAILTAGVAAWRGGRPLAAGLLIGSLAYKPQLAIAVGLALWVCEGRRALAGLLISGLALLAAGEWIAPGSTIAFLTKVSGHAAMFQQSPGYNWGRQMTPTAFLRTLLGVDSSIASVIGHAISAALLIAVAWIAYQLRPVVQVAGKVTTDRLNIARTQAIALSICALPLCAPYFMDYDLLLLVIPAALLSTTPLARGVVGLGLLMWLTLYVNVDLVAATRINLVVLLLLVAVGLLIYQVGRAKRSVAVDDLVPGHPLALQPTCP